MMSKMSGRARIGLIFHIAPNAIMSLSVHHSIYCGTKRGHVKTKTSLVNLSAEVLCSRLQCILAHILGYQTGPHLYWGLGLGLVLLFCFQSPLHKEICCLVIPRCVKGFGGISTPRLFSSHRVNAASSGLSTHMCKAFSEWSYCLAEASHVAGH